MYINDGFSRKLLHLHLYSKWWITIRMECLRNSPTVFSLPPSPPTNSPILTTFPPTSISDWPENNFTELTGKAVKSRAYWTSRKPALFYLVINKYASCTQMYRLLYNTVISLRSQILIRPAKTSLTVIEVAKHLFMTSHSGDRKASFKGLTLACKAHI